MLDHVDYCMSENQQDAVVNEVAGTRNSVAEDDDELNEDDVELKVERTSEKQISIDICETTQELSKGKTRARTCFLCNKSFASQYTLNRHLSSQHQIKLSPTTRLLQCPVDKCTSYFHYMGSLRDHLRKGHKINIVGETKHKFISLEAFQNWKKQEEKVTHTRFVRPHGKYRRHDGAEVHQFYCHRSGNYRAEGKGLRKLKSKGSCKMGSVCPATMTAYELLDGTVDVKYFSTHVGHFTDREELYFSNEERSRVNSMVSAGEPFHDVLDHVRNSLCAEMDGLSKFIQKDLRLIDKTFDLWQHDKLDKPNAFNISTLLQELACLGADNPIVYNKLPWSENGSVIRDELLVVVMTSLQSDMLQKFGNDGMVCIDTMLDKDDVEFCLVAILTVDNFGQAYPCAFCLTNRLDDAVLSTFFREIQKKCGTIRPKYLMSDGDEGCLKSWSACMEMPEKCWINSWHVDRICRKNLTKVTGKPYQKAATYKALRVLIREPNLKKFDLLLNAFKMHMLEGKYTEPFGKYFESEWVSRAEKWAFCHRGEPCSGYDLELEALHMMLAHIYPKGKVKRMDTTLQVIFRFLRDKSFDRMIRCFPEKCPARASVIQGRHQASLSLSPKNVVPFETRKWIVKSQRGEFLVEQNDEECGDACALRCANCGICVHTFTCSCTDSIIRGTLCKHIHLVGRSIGQVVQDMEVEVFDQGLVVVANDALDLPKELQLFRHLPTVDHTDLDGKIEELVTEIKTCTGQISNNASNINDYEVLKALHEGLKKLTQMSDLASMNACNANNIICIQLQDLQSVLCNGDETGIQ